MTGSDTSMSSISNLPKILPNYQQRSPQNRILDIHLSLLDFENSFELHKDISKKSLVILHIYTTPTKVQSVLYVLSEYFHI